MPPIPEIGAQKSLSLENSVTPSATPAIRGAASAEAKEANAAVSSEKTNPAPTLSLGSSSQQTPATQSGDPVTLNLAPISRSSPSGRTMSPTEVANALENHPAARPYHKLLVFEVRARQDPILTDQFVADAIQRCAAAYPRNRGSARGWFGLCGCRRRSRQQCRPG